MCSRKKTSSWYRHSNSRDTGYPIQAAQLFRDTKSIAVIGNVGVVWKSRSYSKAWSCKATQLSEGDKAQARQIHMHAFNKPYLHNHVNEIMRAVSIVAMT